MALDRKAQTATAAFERRRPVAATVQRRPATAAPSPARALHERLGNQATQTLVARSVQMSRATRLPAKVSKPHDAAELEAEEAARKVVRMREPSATPPAEPKPKTTGVMQRAAAATATRAASPGGARVHIGGGTPLPRSVRSFMEPRFGASFSHVRVHADHGAARQAAQVSAQAFTVGSHVFFGRDKYQPQTSSGRELIAHELTHTIQQGASVQRSAEPTVAHRTEPRVQRLWGVEDALDWIADKANYIPGFRLLTIVLGMNPINWKSVDRSTANMLRAILELVPVVGPLVVKALDEYKIIKDVADWADEKISALGLVGSALKHALDEFLDSLSWSDIVYLDEVYERGKRIFTDPIDQLLELGASMVSDILAFIRKAVLLPLAALAKDTPAYDLLTAVLEEDPITGVPVKRNPEAVIGGFMKLIGQEEIFENAKKAGAVQRIWAWFQGALQTLVGFVMQIPGLFVTLLESLEIFDLFPPTKAFNKVVTVFGGFVVKFVSWAGNALWTLLEIVFDVLAPGLMPYLKKAGAALMKILEHPIDFVMNLVGAAKLGFNNFADHFEEHLKDSILEWLLGALPGVYIPQSLALAEIAKFAFSVLGLTWANIREKLVKATNETTVKVLETSFDLVVTLVTEGPAAAWEQIKEQLANLKQMVIGGIINMIVGIVTKKAIPKLLAMFIPGAGFISAIISIYDTIMVFVDKLATIRRVVKSFLDSIMAIANGAIDVAAGRVEKTLAGLLSLAISFLAGFAGLGNVADKVLAVIEKVRAPIDKALDWLVGWIVKAAKTVIAKGKAAVKKLISWAFATRTFKDGTGKQHSLFVNDKGQLTVASAPMAALDFVNWYEKTYKGDAKVAADARTLIADAQKVVVEIETQTTAKPDEVPAPALQKKLLELNTKISEKLSQLVKNDPRIAADLEKKYLLEGQVGTYATIPKPVGDKLTPDHQPQASVIEAAAEFFRKRGIEGEELAKRAENRAHQGFAINLHFRRHVAGATYGSKGETRAGFLERLLKLARGKTLPQAKDVAVKELRGALDKDVAQMKSVAAAPITDPAWAQLNEEFKDDPAKATTLKQQISSRIVAGENQIASQPLDF